MHARNLTSVLVPLLIAGGAQAQTQTQTGADYQLEEITVTAQRVGQNLQDVPVSVSAFSAAEIDRLQITSVGDLTRLAPNVKFDTVTGGTAGLKPYIRGGGISDGALVTSESEVSLYVDEVYRARLSASLIDFLELERIEVLRGPQGVLYGRNSSAGAVNIITKKPSETLTGTFQLGYGSWNERRARGYLSGPLSADGRWRGAVNAMIRGRDGGRQYNETLGKKVGEDSFEGVQGDIAFVDETFDARLTAFYLHGKSDGQYAVSTVLDSAGNRVPASGSYRRVTSPVESFTRLEQYGGNLRLSLDYGGGRLTSISGYSELKDSWRQDFSGGVRGTAFGNPSNDFFALFDRVASNDQHQFSQEIQAAGSFADGFVEYVAGVYYFTESGTQDVLSTIFFAPSLTVYTIKTDSYAAFGQATFNVTDQLALIAGGRYTKDDKSLRATVAGTPVSLDNEYTRFTPKLGVNYKINDDVLAYASYSEGFKAGGYNGLASTAVQLAEPFGQQVTKAYEAGIKADLLDNRLRFNLAGFYNKIKNRQQTVNTSDGGFLVENYDVTIKGLELELSWMVTAGLRLWGNGSLNDGKYTGTDSAVASILNNDPPVVPDYQYTVGFDYTLAAGAGELRFGADYSKRDAYFSTPDNAIIGAVEKQDFVNGYVSYDINDWSFQLSGKNLLQEHGWQTGFGFSVVQPRFAIEPRTWLATVRYQF